ncbi:DNA (cytosine-5-)-methyltransferase [Sulfurimonas sp. NWX367]|uniref:DNA (cytosine-5-)-methyltransferase n=1 Tax=unclassified Sulfurimonas TaxID=2623549 RepID=UPI0032046823
MKNLIKKTNPNPIKGLSSYKNSLNESNILTCGSICSGIGAFEQALKNIGITHINKYMVEIDKFARKTFEANHTVEHTYKDLTQLDSTKMPYVDLLVLSLPCQSFSMQGKRGGFNDTRGTLTFDALKIVKETKPKYIIFENVKGIINHDKGNTFEVIKAAFEELDYKIYYQVLNSKHFGSAQNRERLFLVAIRKDIQHGYHFPEPQSNRKSVNEYIEINKNYSCCLYDASKRVPFNAKRVTDIIKLWKLPHIKYASDQRICSTEGIAPCIVASSAKTKFYDTKNKLFRYLTLEEMAAIQGFPSDFVFPVSNAQKKKQIGNSITISVLEAIIENLLLYIKPTSLKSSSRKTEQKTKSLLQTLKSMKNISSDIITKNIKKIRSEELRRSSQTIVKNITKPFVSKNMYVNQALISYSKDKDLFASLKSMNEKELQIFLKQRDLEIINYDSFSDDTNTKKFVLFPYAGGKQGVNKTDMQQLAINAFKNKKYTKFIDIFAGGMGATYNVLPVLLQNSIEEVVINDINKSIINVYRQIQRKSKQVQRHLASIPLDYYKKYGKFAPVSREEARELHISIEKEFKDLELQKKMSPRRAALFLFLIHKSTGAMLDYDMKTKTCFFETSYKIINIELLINKVALYHKILTSTKITFKSVQYQTLLKKYKNSSDALLLIDPPYIEYSEKVSNNSSSFTYGIDFNHKELLNKMKNIQADFIYYNNHNPLIENFATRYSYRYSKNIRTYANGVLKDRTKAVEVCMTKLPKRSNKSSSGEQFETPLVA